MLVVPVDLLYLDLVVVLVLKHVLANVWFLFHEQDSVLLSVCDAPDCLHAPNLFA